MPSRPTVTELAVTVPPVIVTRPPEDPLLLLTPRTPESVMELAPLIFIPLGEESVFAKEAANTVAPVRLRMPVLSEIAPVKVPDVPREPVMLNVPPLTEVEPV